MGLRSFQSCKVGDIVKIQHQLPESRYNPFGINSDMEALAGKYAKITEMGREPEGTYVRLDIDRERYMWSRYTIDSVISIKNKGNGSIKGLNKFWTFTPHHISSTYSQAYLNTFF